jgi:hypothetical protein
LIFLPIWDIFIPLFEDLDEYSCIPDRCQY